MKNKMIIAVLMVLAGCFSSVFAAGSAKLNVHLPREMTIDSDVVTLGSIGVVTGDENLVSEAKDITLVRLIDPKDDVVIDRVTILSRLADNNIPKSKVHFTGAEQISVGRKSRMIEGQEIVSFARSFLQQQGLHKSVCGITERRVPEDMLLADGNYDLRMTGKLLGSGSKSQSRVKVYVYAGKKEIGRSEITFDLKYKCHVAVCTQDIEANEVLTRDNIKVENSIAELPEDPGWRPPFGLMAKRMLSQGTEITPDMLDAVLPATLVERNQNVVIKLEMPGLLITAMGKAMEEGRRGEIIKVRNSDSQRIIIVEVNEDGTVEPIL